MLAPQLKPAIEQHAIGSCRIIIYIPVGSCSTPGELWCVVHHICDRIWENQAPTHILFHNFDKS